MAGQRRLSADEIHARTPPERNRYADLLRVGSLMVVVLGHWLIAVVIIRDGRLETERLLESVQATVWLTWLLQVMPVFFMVGGYANAASLSKERAGVDWVRIRARRLIRPVVPLFAVWTALTVAMVLLDAPSRIIGRTTSAAVVPVWFLAAYLAIVTLAPALYRLHRRHGVTVLATFVALAMTVDVLFRFSSYDVGPLGYANYLFVWGAAHQVGFFWHDGRLPSRTGAWALAAAGYAALGLLVGVADYPVSMVGGPQKPTNTTPPSVAILALAVGQLGILLALRRRAEAWLDRPRPWAVVVRAGAVMMTVFLWHMTALVLVAAALVPTGLWPNPEPTQAAWWLLRPVWIAVLAVVLAGLVAVFGRFERAPPPAPTKPGPASVLIIGFGVVATFTSMAVIVDDGVYDGRYWLGAPWIELAVFAVGLVALGVVGKGGGDRGAGTGQPER